MPQPRPQASSAMSLLTPRLDPLAPASPTAWWVQEPRPGGGELWQRTAAWYAQLRALPRRLRRALQRQLALPLAGVALVLALGQAPSQAATITVDGTTCTLADAIMAANTDTAQGGCPAGSGADTLVLEPPGGSVTLTRVDNTTYGPTALPVIRSVITIAGQGSTIARDPNAPAFRLLAVNDSGNLTVQGVTLTGGVATGYRTSGGGVLNRDGIVAIEDCTISGNSGGGVENFGHTYATLTLSHSTISGNSGGGVMNVANYGGAILTVMQSTISGNSGDGVFNESYYSYDNGGADVTVIQSIISDNSGAGVRNCDCSIYGHKGATLTLTQSTISGNTNSGVRNNYVIMITDSTISGNTASRGGGVHNYGRLTLTNSTISGNRASVGGGVYGYLSNVTLTDSTISGNTASRGGGVMNNIGHVTLINSTISGNRASVGGGVVNTGGYFETRYGSYRGYGILTLTSSIVAINRGDDCLNDADYASITSQGYNLDSDGSCQLTAPTDQPGVDPQLGPLQDNGGPTFTHALQPGSPAIDVIPWGTNGCGTTISSDQRWQARPQAVGGSCDIGAYEVEVAGQPLGAWVIGLTPRTVVCQNMTTGHEVTLQAPDPAWDCEAAGLGITAGDRVALRVRGSVAKGATDVGGAVVGMAPSSGGCTNLTTGQQVAFQHMVGATAASCVAAGLVMDPRDIIQISVQGVAQ